MILKAIIFATKAHAGQYRKGTDVPYIVHPISVGMSLLHAGAPEDAVVAGILHDTLEDTKATADELRREFGDAVTAIVQGCSEPDKSMPWEERKRHTMKYLQVAPPEVLMVTCADKLCNVRDIAWALRHVGDKVWQRFNRGRMAQEWYYREILLSIRALYDHPQGSVVRTLWEELAYEVDVVFGRTDCE